ncbi:HPr kinase/phosphorylase [Flavimaricola marinus]|uniref:HPr kinase/phosphorylase n=1 Tax=Flavimaricola marinus TaxID=1819565 RepID=A0A238LAR1_9RHOB|nr:HPr kinase/phosphatase C-terminal domain-containing protein [Flavimaricola marinus]SMY06759.1 HPr kinase/phosphorylase [Flavimaricola marinus]
MPDPANLTLHANSVAYQGKAILITGGAGRGKSTLSLALMGRGCGLIADDQTYLSVQDGQLMAACPPAISGLIEARGIGILNATAHPPAPVALCIDMDRTETERLPPQRSVTYLGVTVPLILHVQHCHFDAAVMHYISAGRNA